MELVNGLTRIGQQELEHLGNSEEAFAAQTASIIKSVDEVARGELLKNMNIKITIPAAHVADMKATQNIPWNLLRIIRSWLGTFNIKLSSEASVREVANEWVGKGLCCEYDLLITKKNNKSEVTNSMVLYI